MHYRHRRDTAHVFLLHRHHLLLLVSLLCGSMVAVCYIDLLCVGVVGSTGSNKFRKPFSSLREFASPETHHEVPVRQFGFLNGFYGYCDSCDCCCIVTYGCCKLANPRWIYKMLRCCIQAIACHGSTPYNW